MAYVGEVPWHGLGTEVPDGIDVDGILKAAGLDWTVEKRPSAWQDTDGLWIEDPRNFKLVRMTDKKALSNVGPDYVPIQNREAFSFFKAFTEAGAMSMHTAGSLRGGRTVWALAKMNKGFTIRKGGSEDRVEGHLLVSCPHELGQALKVKFTPVRVVCQNTLSMALKSGKGMFRMAHIREFDEEMQKQAALALDISTELLDAYFEKANHLANRQARPNDVKKFIAQLFDEKALVGPDGELLDVVSLDEANRMAKRVLEAIDTQPGHDLETSKGTWWGVFNAVTFVIDHKTGHNRDAALHNAWFSGRASDKNQALTLALEFAK